MSESSCQEMELCMKWKITFYKGVGESILENWPVGIKTKFARIADMLKTQKTPKKEIELAIKRMKEVKGYE
jgi:hypothetical protein